MAEPFRGRDRFYAAILPGSGRFFGITLGPFTLWKRALLEAIDSPFVDRENLDRDITPRDLIEAIRLCDCEGPKFGDHAPDFQETRWFRKVRIRLEKKPGTFSRLVKYFGEYVGDGMMIPELGRRENAQGSFISAPETLALVAAVCQACAGSVSMREAWELSPGFAGWWIATNRELTTSAMSEDRPVFMNPEDFEAVDELPDLNALSIDEAHAALTKYMGAEYAEQWRAEKRQT